MGSIPGPIITFRIDAPQLAGATQGAFQEVKNQARQTSAQVADDWKRMAAQIRASAAQGVLGAREEADMRSTIVSRLELQIRAMNRLAELNTRQLAQYKAMTLELERQKSHLGGTGGLTTGTLAAAGQFSTQTYLGITRALDSLVNRYFGGVAGSAFRTIRDLGYYGSIGAGAAAGEGGAGAAAGGGIFSTLKAGLSSFVAEIPSSVLAVGGVTAAVAAIGVTAATVTRHMENLAQSIENTAAATGLSTKQVQEYSELAKEMGINAVTVENSFARLQVQLGQYITHGKTADESTQNFIRTATLLGVKVTDAFGKLRPVNDILGDFASKTGQIADVSARSAVRLDALGIRGKVLAQVMDEADREGTSLASVLKEIGASGVIISDSQINSLLQAKHSWDELTRAVTGYKIQIEGAIADTTLFAVRNSGQFFKDVLGAFGSGNIAGLTTDIASQGITQAAKNGKGIDVAKLERAKELEKERTEYAKKRAEFEHKIWQEFDEHAYRAGFGRSGAPFLLGPSREQIYNRVFHPQAPFTPGLGVGPEAQTGNVLAGLGIGVPGVGVSTGATQQDILKSILGGDYDKIFNTKEQQYQQELAQLKSALDNNLIAREQYNAAVLSINDDLHKEMMRKNEEFNHQADELFEQLINGDKNFGRTLVKDLRDSMLAPIRNAFDQTVGGLLGGFSRATTAGFNGATGGLSRFATVPFLGSLIPGLGANKNTPTGAAGDPIYVVFPGMSKTAGVGTAAGAGGGGVGGGLLGLLGIGGSGGGFASALSGTGLSIGSGGIIGGSLPLIGPGGSLIPGGASSGGGGILGSLKGLVGFGGKNGGFNLKGGLASLGTIGGGLLMSLGASTGGALGGLEGGAGGALSGALSGLMVGGPIGAAIGGIIGGIGGLITGIIGPSFQQRVQKAMVNQAYYAPPSETFSFASNGSIASTLGTGFSQSGGRFSQFGLPNNTPFYASALTGRLSYSQWLALQNENNLTNTGQPFLGFPSTNPYLGQGPVGSHATTPAPTVQVHLNLPGYIDGASAVEALGPVAHTIAQLVSTKISSSSSGLGSAIRRANNLP
ncbi:MAG: hypothetical protein ACRD8A_14605 [Candidatus Acidiferrales bacterium]